MPSTKSESASKIVALGRANKTEAVQIRVDPKRRFVLEMIARRWNRPVSSVLEEVMDDWLTRTQSTNLKAAESAWSPFAADRFVKQVQTFPDTLTDMENVLWAVIAGDARFWSEGIKRPRPKVTEANFNFELLRKEWETLCQRALDSKKLQDIHSGLKDKMNSKGVKA